MIRRTDVVTIALVCGLVVAGVVPAAAQVRSGGGTRSQQSVAAGGHHDPWIAKGAGGKNNEGREDNDDQQYPGKTTFTIDDHAPGATSNSFNIYAEGFGENIRMHWNVVQQEAFDFSSCTSTSATAFGIDRGNDDPGTKTDESLLDAYKSVSYTKHNIFVEFYKEEKLAGGPKKITVNDQIVSRVTNCLKNPSDPGWYRLTGYINGSTKMDTQTDYTIYGASRFVYVCEGCDSRQAAIDKLGPPPTRCPTTDEFDQDSKEWTCRTDDGTYSTNSNPPGSDDSSSKTTPTPAATATATSTGTATRTATPAPSTATATTKPQANTATEKQTRQPDDRTATRRRTVTATRAPNRGRRTRSPAVTPVTPTLANGPGFGSLLSLVGLLAAALLALRQE